MLRDGTALTPVVWGVAGKTLQNWEWSFFRDADPFGFILFGRNVTDPEQTSRLVSDLREAVGRNAPVLIDQEGGRVQRIGPPHVPAYPPAAEYGRIARRDLTQACEAVRLGHALLGRDLSRLGINVDCAPVLDLAVEGASSVIGDRSFSADPETVACLGSAACEGLAEAGVLPVVKHVPGHGRATVDSHKELPVVETSRETLQENDFVPFRALAEVPMAMTAHVVYTAFDAGNPLTTSKHGIRDLIRGTLGFNGLLISDDLSMEALSGSLEDRARGTLDAGCDLALHCNGKFSEMKRIAGAVPATGKDVEVRWERAFAWLDSRRRDPGEIATWQHETLRQALADV